MTKTRKTLNKVWFSCSYCRYKWQAEPDRVAEHPEDEVHPWVYFADCPKCSTADQTQAAWERNLLKAHLRATGPTTPEGIAAVSKNLEGHPTPEEARRTRFNALKHGLYSEVATYFPASPGKYAQCKTCDRLYDGCGTDGFPACTKKTELFLKHRVALETRDPRVLTRIHADFQGSLMALAGNMIADIAADGTTLRSPKFTQDQNGDTHLAKYVDEKGELQHIHDIYAHPTLKPLLELVSRNSLSLEDLAMTPKVQEDTDTARGHLDDAKQDRESLVDFQRRQTEAQETLLALIENSKKRAAADPVLIEHQQSEGEHHE